MHIYWSVYLFGLSNLFYLNECLMYNIKVNHSMLQEIEIKDHKSSIELTCNTDSDKNITWFRSVYGSDIDNHWRIESLGIERYKIVGNNTLIIEKPSRKIDEADFVCIIGFDIGTFRIRGIPEIRPLKPINYTSDVNSFKVSERDNVSIICEVPLGHNFKDDEVMFKWYKQLDDGSEKMIDEKSLTSERTHDGKTYGEAKFYLTRSFLHLSDIRHTDRALYICEAINGKLKARRTIRLRVGNYMATIYPFLGICGEILIMYIISLVNSRKL
ncbi:basigin-like [Brevipalpus obovatus]|uniref:basigin-like n=1 Tax=Brevipalpus obovatus TaxID=246614 RepID=UPI003D9E79D4